MKWAMMLASVMFMLLSMEVQAKEVYFAVLSVDLVGNKYRGYDALDLEIRANSHDLHYYFWKGDLYLDKHHVFVMRGGRGSLARALDQYKDRYIKEAYYANGCYKKRILRENTTYVIVYREADKVAVCQVNYRATSSRGVSLDDLSSGLKFHKLHNP